MNKIQRFNIHPAIDKFKIYEKTKRNESASNFDDLDFHECAVLIAGATSAEMFKLSKLLADFGVQSVKRCHSGAQARALVTNVIFDLLIVDHELGDIDGLAFTRWLRRHHLGANGCVPVILMDEKPTALRVCEARDSGVSLYLRKPAPASVVLQRARWAIEVPRRFISSPDYCGPDRRTRALGPPIGSAGRRRGDLKGRLGKPRGPNLQQDEIDALLSSRDSLDLTLPVSRPRRISGL